MSDTKAIHDWHDPVWIPVKDGDLRCWNLYRRHYSAPRRLSDHDRRIAGPGEKMMLITPDAAALWVWRKFVETGATRPRGVNCAVFRLENSERWLASDLIRAAVKLAVIRWPGERLYTYVNPKRIRSAHPGYCFKMAGWRVARATKRGLVELELETGVLAGTTTRQHAQKEKIHNA